MILFRLSKAAYAKDLTGKGAEKSGGRWNSKGTPMVYTCANRALCTAEIAVHTPLGNVPVDYKIITLEIPDRIKINELPVRSLPADWNIFPHPNSTQKLGEKFVNDNLFLILKVPSVVVQGEYNYLINPKHKDHKSIKIRSIDPFRFDERLFK